MFEFLNITKALAEENRLRILLALKGEELCVCQLIELLELAPSTVSKHISVLRQARLVDSRKDGRWMYYRLSDESAPSEVTEAIAWVKTSLAENSRIRKDAKRLNRPRSDPGRLLLTVQLDHLFMAGSETERFVERDGAGLRKADRHDAVVER